MKKSMKKSWRPLLVGIAVLLGLLMGDAVTRTGFAVSDITYEKLKVFSEVYSMIKKKYVEEAEDKELLYGAIKGMLKTLDPHSSFLTPESFKNMRVETSGKFGGLGIEITAGNNAIKVVSPIEDTPAYRAGMKAGDLIIKIEEESTQDMTLMEAVKLMRGKPDTDINLTVIRKGENEPLKFTITRAIIKIRSVKWRNEQGDLGYVRIIQFNEQTMTLLEKALKEIQEKAEEQGGLKGLVLDLRNDPGGLLDQAVQVSDAFLEGGRIVYTQSRIKGKDMRFDANPGDLSNGVPIVVLINSGSASASEIVAGALQDHKRAIIMGSKSFGKGSVQTIIPLSDGSGLRLTTAQYYTPSGRTIQAKGIEPDILVEDLKFAGKNGNGRKQTTEKDLKRHLKSEEEKSAEEGIDKKDGQNGSEKDDKGETDERDRVTGRSKEDYQLQRALDLLRGYQIFSTKTAAK